MMLLLVSPLRNDINVVGATEKNFYETQLCIIQSKIIKSKVMILCF